MRVKDNQPRLRDALVALCAERDPVDRYETADRGRHGRQEHRRVEVFEVADRLPPEWRGTIACAARVSRLSWCKDTRAGRGSPAARSPTTSAKSRWTRRPSGGRFVPIRHREPRPPRARPRAAEDDSRIRRKPGVFAPPASFALNILRAGGVSNVSEAIYTNALSFDCLLAYGQPTSEN